jgi:hypothetical protein
VAASHRLPAPVTTANGSVDSTTPLARRELWIAAVAVLSVLLVPLLVPALRPLITRPLWLDELHTWLLSRELPSSRLVSQLERGADFNPPLLYVVDSLLLYLLPASKTQIVLRLTSLLAVAGTMLLLYRIHRGRFGVVASAAGALAPLANFTVVWQLFEARFYSPWLLLTVAVAWALEQVVEHPRSRVRFAALVLLAAATCLVHYFGIISLGCLALGVVVKLRQPSRLWRPLLGLVLGMLALVAWMPVYAAQAQVVSVHTWVPAPTLRTLYDFLRETLAYPPYLIVVAVAIGFAVLRRAPRRPPITPSVAQAALLGLLAMPIVLVVFSVLLQPVHIPRYAFPALAGASVLVALATSRLPRPLAMLVLVALLANYGKHEVKRARMARAFSLNVTSAVRDVNGVAGDPRPVVSLDRFSLYPTALSAANRNARLAFLVIPRDTIRAYYQGPMAKQNADFDMVERDGSVAHNAVLGFPALISLEALRAQPSFYMLLPDSGVKPPFPLLFRDRHVCLASSRLLFFGAARGASADTLIAPCGEARR